MARPERGVEELEMLFEFDMPMTWREAKYFFFAKKSCPKCLGPIQRQTSTHDEGLDWRRDGFDLNYSHKTKVTVAYECRPCRVWYSLAELANKPSA